MRSVPRRTVGLHQSENLMYDCAMKRLQIMIDEDLDDTLARLASERHTSKAALIRDFVRAAICTLPPLKEDPLFTMEGTDSYEPTDSIDTIVYR